MKKFLIIATLLAIAVFASAYTSRNFWIELQLDQLDIMNYVDTAFPGHDADFVLSVTDGIDVISTETHHPVVIKVTVNAGPNGPVAWATFTAAGFSTPGYSWNKTFTITITYPGNTDPETNSATMSYTTAASGNAAIWLYGDNAWQLPDSIILGAAAPTTTYTLNIAINDDVLTTPGTYTINGQPYQAQLVDDNDEVNDLIGTYTISDAPEGYYWSVNPIVVSEADFDPDTNIANITFVLVANPDSWTYKMKLTASDGGTYNFTGPVSGVTGTEYSTGPQTTSNNPYLGAYTVTSEPPMGYTWVNTQVELGPDDFISAKADYVFMATKQFVLQLMPITYTLNIVFPDGYTITGPGGPFTTSPAVVTDNDDTVNDLIGNVYTASDAPAGFHWVVNPIEVTAEMFEKRRYHHLRAAARSGTARSCRTEQLHRHSHRPVLRAAFLDHPDRDPDGWLSRLSQHHCRPEHYRTDRQSACPRHQHQHHPELHCGGQRRVDRPDLLLLAGSC